MKAKTKFLGLIFGTALLIQGCGGSGGGGGSSTTVTGPTAVTKANTEQHIAGTGLGLVGASFTTFGPNSRTPKAPTAGGPFYDSRLGLWVVVSVTLTSFTETFYQDQAETEPAGTAAYTLNIAAKTLSGNISITAGTYSGLTGTYTETISGSSLTGTQSLTLPSGTTIASTFTVSKGANGYPTGTATETVTESGGYSETSTVTYNSDGSFKIVASDTNGYTSTLNFASDRSGTGTVNGPDPGLPASLKWDSTGTGTVTFAGGIVLNFTNWQFPKHPSF